MFMLRLGVLLLLSTLIFTPGAATAQLTSENYTVTGSAFAPGSPTVGAGSAGFDAEFEVGALFILDTSTPPPTPPPATTPGRSSGGSRTNTPALTAAPVASASLLIGPARAEQGGQVVLAVLLLDKNKKPIDPPGRAVSLRVRGANNVDLQAERLDTGVYTSQYAAVNPGTDSVNAYVSGQLITNDTDGTSNGTLEIEVAEPVVAPAAPEVVVEPAIPAPTTDAPANDRRAVSSSVTLTCNRLFTWEQRGRIEIERRVAGGEFEPLATLRGNMTWYIDTEPLEPQELYYQFSFPGNVVTEMVVTADQFAACAPDPEAIERSDIDSDTNSEEFVDGVFQDLDGSTMPLAVAGSEGLLLDTNEDGEIDLYWLPGVGTSTVIVASDRLFVTDPTVVRSQSYLPVSGGGYRVLPPDTTAAPSAPQIETEYARVLGDDATAPEDEPSPVAATTQTTLPVLPYLISLGFFASIVTLLSRLERVPLSITNIHYFAVHGWSHLFALLAFWRKRKAWGTAYDSATKAPVDPAIVKLLREDGTVETSAITDLDGRYGFIVPPGLYTMQVKKNNYLFPSRTINFKTQDVLYSNLYFGESIVIGNEQAAVAYDVPMDPQAFDWNQHDKMTNRRTHFVRRLDIWLVRLLAFSFYIGLLAVLWQWFEVRTLGSALIALVYILLLALRYTRGKPLLYGVVTKAGRPLKYALIKVFNGDTVVAQKITDQYGRYTIMVVPGRYTMQIEERVDQETFTPILERAVNAKGGIINGNISL